MDVTPPQIIFSDGTSASATAPGVPRLRWWERLGISFLAISIAAHVLFGVVAAYLIVQTSQVKRKQAFAGTPSRSNAPERAIEHRVQMEKKRQTMSAPATRRVTTISSNTKVALPSVPTMPRFNSAVAPMSMTAMGGTGLGSSMGGSGGGGGGLSLFGIRDSKRGAGLEGTFYDLKQTGMRQPTNMTPETYGKILTDFAIGGFNEGVLSRFYKSTRPLATTQIWIPQIYTDSGPAALPTARRRATADVVRPLQGVRHGPRVFYLSFSSARATT